MKKFLSFILERKDVMEHETGAINSLNLQIEKHKAESGSDHVPVKIGGKVHHITKAEKVPGTPTADFRLTDKSGNHIYLSHKAGSSVKDFQQFSGTTQHAEHPAVQRLVKHIKSQHGGEGSKMGGTIATKLDRSNPEDNKLLHKAAFGVEHGSGRHGINNVHAIVQGPVSLTKHKQGHFEITANHVYENRGGKGSLPKHIEGMVSARYMNRRKNHGLNNVRTGVLPVGSRTVKEFV